MSERSDMRQLSHAQAEVVFLHSAEIAKFDYAVQRANQIHQAHSASDGLRHFAIKATLLVEGEMAENFQTGVLANELAEVPIEGIKIAHFSFSRCFDFRSSAVVSHRRGV